MVFQISRDAQHYKLKSGEEQKMCKYLRHFFFDSFYISSHFAHAFSDARLKILANFMNQVAKQNS